MPAEITEHIDESTVVILNKSDLCQLPLDLDDIASQCMKKNFFSRLFQKEKTSAHQEGSTIFGVVRNL